MNYLARSDGRVHGGEPVANRDDTHGFDQFLFPNGLQVQFYDDGRVKVGGWHHTVEVTDVSNHLPGKSGPGSGHVVARFARRDDTPDPVKVWAERTRRSVTAESLDEMIAAEAAAVAAAVGAVTAVMAGEGNEVTT